MKKHIIFLILISVFVVSCGDLGGSSKQSQAVQETPPIEPENPEPPADKDLKPEVCYFETSRGQTCFEVYDIDNVNSAEPKYNYVDSFNDPNFPSGLDKWQYRSPVNLLYSSQHLATAPLSENFLRFEMLDSNDTRGHYGFFSPEALSRIQQMRESFGKPLIINSGYRSPGYNATLKGAAKFSRHTFGDAIDFKIPGVSFQEIAQKCLDLGAGYYQIYSSHVHCDWRTTPLNETIYGQDLRPSTHSHDFHDVADILSAQVVITASKVASTQSSRAAKRPVRLAAENVVLEDGEGISYQWEVYQNDTLVRSSDEATPVIPLMPGTYKVYVNIGGSMESESQVVVE